MRLYTLAISVNSSVLPSTISSLCTQIQDLQSCSWQDCRRRAGQHCPLLKGLAKADMLKLVQNSPLHMCDRKH